MTYDYNKPRGVNFVSIFFLLVLVAGIYVAVKFVPVWWQGKKVDRELDELRLQAVDFGRYGEDYRRKKTEDIVAQAVARIHDLGVEDEADQPVQVWFSPDYTELHARYEVVVRHPGNVIKPTVMTMDRAVEVPR
jgi:hypothetical protein